MTSTIFYNKNYNFLNAANKSKLIIVLESQRLSLVLPLCEIVDKQIANSYFHLPPSAVLAGLCGLVRCLFAGVSNCTGAQPIDPDSYQILHYKYLLHFFARISYCLIFLPVLQEYEVTKKTTLSFNNVFLQ